MRFSILSSDGQTTRYSGKPTYNGTFMKVSYIEFREICSDIPINWEVGDYVDYTRMGMRYKLYSIPQPVKNARQNTSGKAFVYNNVQLFADTKQLEIALFRDIVAGDNYVHFSTQQAISTYENVEGILNRIQACMDEYAPNQWVFQLSDSTDTEFAEAREFTMSGGTCLDALQKIYDTWDNAGWVHTIQNNKNYITIGLAKNPTSTRTCNLFKYGLGLGLKSIKKTQANKEDMATRLYAYGSNRNIRSGYYRSKDILNADSVDIQNLMIPIANWGKTLDDEQVLKPDARKAFVQDNDAISEYGLIPKSVYFDGSEQEEIYPSIKKVTIGEIRSAKSALQETEYVPDASIYTDPDERVDEIKNVTNPTDDGAIDSTGGKSYSEIDEQSASSITKTIQFTQDDIGNKEITFDGCESIELSENDSNIKVDNDITGQVSVVSSGEGSGAITTIIEMYLVVNGETKSTLGVVNRTGNFTFTIPEISASAIQASSSAKIVYFVRCHNGATGQSHTITINFSSGTYSFISNYTLANNFTLTLKQIGFNIAQRATLGDGNMVHFLDGKCAGRSFLVKKTKYQSATDTWLLTMSRGKDTSTGYYYPNCNYEIEIGDHFVLLDIAMPEIYINIASARLLTAANNLLAQTSKIEPFYEPEIDAKKMIENITAHQELEDLETYILREGKYFYMQDTDVIDGTDNETKVLIDTLTINENESDIPTYKITLREKKKLTFQQATANAIDNLNQKVTDASGTVPLSGGTQNYDELYNVPTIDGVELRGNLDSYDSLGLISTEQIEVDTTTISGTTLLKMAFMAYSSGFKVINGTGDELLRGNGTCSSLTSNEVLQALSNKVKQFLNGVTSLSGNSKVLIGYIPNSDSVSGETLRTLTLKKSDDTTIGTYNPWGNIDQSITIPSGGASALSELSDVQIGQAPLANQDMLVYDNSVSKWKNVAKVDLPFAPSTHTHTKSQITDLGNVAMQGDMNNLLYDSNEFNFAKNSAAEVIIINHKGSSAKINEYHLRDGYTLGGYAKLIASGFRINGTSADNLILANGNGSIAQADLIGGGQLARKGIAIGRSASQYGWYRVYDLGTSSFSSAILHMNRNYYYHPNEAYIVSIVCADGGSISVTQLSGVIMSSDYQYIQQIRVVSSGGHRYVDVLCGKSYSVYDNYYFSISGVEGCVVLTPTLISTEPSSSDILKTFIIGNGIISDRGYKVAGRTNNRDILMADGSIVNVADITVGTATNASNAGNAEFAQKIGTMSSHPAIGDATHPVYVDNEGQIQPCTSISGNAQFNLNYTDKEGTEHNYPYTPGGENITASIDSRLEVEELTNYNSSIGEKRNGSVLTWSSRYNAWYADWGSLTTSDRNLKVDIEELDTEKALQFVKDNAAYEYAFTDNPDDKWLGFMAQDFQKDYPNSVRERSGILKLDYNATIAVLFSAVKELTKKVEALETELNGSVFTKKK